jgi:hypothetical protein
MDTFIETQQTIMLWGARTFGDISPKRAARRSLEEMVELCVEVGLQPLDIINEVTAAIAVAQDKAKGLEHAAEELADVYITLCQLARALGAETGKAVLIHEEVTAKMLVNRARQWAFDGQGSGQHI